MQMQNSLLPTEKVIAALGLHGVVAWVWSRFPTNFYDVHSSSTSA